MQLLGCNNLNQIIYNNVLIQGLRYGTKIGNVYVVAYFIIDRSDEKHHVQGT